MAKLCARRDEATASTAPCCKAISKVSKDLATALERMKATPACAVATAEDWDTTAPKCEDLKSSAEQRMSSANKKNACLEAENVFVKRKRYTNVAGAEQFLLEVQCYLIW